MFDPQGRHTALMPTAVPPIGDLQAQVKLAHNLLHSLLPPQVELKDRLFNAVRNARFPIMLILVGLGCLWVGWLNQSPTWTVGGTLLLVSIVVVSFVRMGLELAREDPEREFLSLSEKALTRQTEVADSLRALHPDVLKYMQGFYADQVSAVESGLLFLIGPLRTLGVVGWFAAFLTAFSALTQVQPTWKAAAPFALALALGFAVAGFRAEAGLQAMRRRRDLLGRVAALPAPPPPMPAEVTP